MKEPKPQDFGMTNEQYNQIKQKHEYSVKRHLEIEQNESLIFGGFAFLSVIIDMYFVKNWFSIYPFCIWLFYKLIFILRKERPLFYFNRFVPDENFFEYEKYLQEYKFWKIDHDKEREVLRRQQEKEEQARQKEINRKNFSHWSEVDPYEFEREIALLFEKYGYQVKVTKGSGDGGIDILLSKSGKKSVVQCKRYKTKVSPSAVRDLYGVMVSGKYFSGYLVCPSGFSEKTFQFAKGKKIGLIGLKRIMQMVNGDKCDFLY